MLATLPSTFRAATFLLARQSVPEWDGWPTTAEILALVGASRSQAYEYYSRLEEVAPTVVRPPGRRPAAPPSASSDDRLLPVSIACFEYLGRHPGSFRIHHERRVYSDGFRRFVLALLNPGEPGEALSTEELSLASSVPLGTLKDWLRAGFGVPTPAGQAKSNPETKRQEARDPRPPAEESAAPASGAQNTGARPEEPPVSAEIRASHVQTIVSHWLSWDGTFQAFCHMLRTEHRVPHSDTFIGDVLQGLGLRSRRRKMPVEAPWSSGTFRNLFPGAHWIGDGTTLAVYWNDQILLFNVEALLDASSNAIVGFHVSDTENEEAVLQAFRAARETTGEPPRALTLDNRPGNHTEGVHATVECIVLAATPHRGQAKAPLEGAFGLFQQTMPPLIIVGQSVREMIRSSLSLILTAWARGRNGKPRKRLGGLSPADAYRKACPTQEQVQEALAWFRELQRRQELARRTREARLDPVRIQLLSQGLAELGIPDPKRRLSIALAGYSRDAIVHGLAVFQAKQELATLPADADLGRYLGGIIRNLHTKLELERTSLHLLKQRIRLRDISLEPLTRAADRIQAERPPSDRPGAFVDLALGATWIIDFRFWATAAADALSALSDGPRTTLYQALCRRISASFQTDRERRGNLISQLAAAAASTAA